MTQALRRGLICAALAVSGLLPTDPAMAAPDPMDYYKTGLTAAEAGAWGQVDKMMREAIAGRPEEKRRLVGRNYFPHYYLGLARYHLGDCPGALASFAESENQGAIVGRSLYNDLLRLQADCKNNGSPSSAGQSSASASTGGKTTKEKVRTGQHVVESGAAPTRKALTALEGVAPEGTELGDAARKGQKVVDVAETATDIVDLAMPPGERLEAAISAYFAGNPKRTLDLLHEIDLGDPRARAQVYLFRAAASYRLYLVAGRDQARLGSARKNADLFQQEQWRKDFPTELFDPRFVRFLRGGG